MAENAEQRMQPCGAWAPTAQSGWAETRSGMAAVRRTWAPRMEDGQRPQRGMPAVRAPLGLDPRQRHRRGLGVRAWLGG
eukprot:1773345-Prymnesium_polylepis.1